jgi:diguanylate cyclase (GGDEF)-like protein
LGIDSATLEAVPGPAVEVLAALLETSRDILPAKVEELRDDVRRLELLGRLNRDLALRDHLTGVANRRGLEERLAAEWDRASRYDHEISIISLDLDGLKSINDSFGHAAGDAVILAVARRLAAHVRTTDVVARVGGDEFVVLCPEIGEEAAATVAAKLTEACRAESVEVAGSEIIPHVSAGWATASVSDGSATRLLLDADRAMYQVKRTAGKRSNRAEA